MDDAGRLAAAVEEKLQEETAENRRAYERFYNNLALFSGGTVALSVTYLGYLETLRRPILHRLLLFASWISLLLCLVFSLLWTFFSAHYVHYARRGEGLGRRADLREAEAAALGVPISSVHSDAESERLFARLLERADSHRAAEAQAARRAALYQRAYKWGGRVARFAFVAGLVLLLWFAVANS